MYKKSLLFLPIFLTVLFTSCDRSLEGESYDPEGSTNTKSKEIAYQVRRTWRLDAGSLSVTNEFTGARLNDFTKVSDTLYRASINPENEPINKSPWYAFGIWSEEPRTVAVEFNYAGEYGHRYYPDVSRDLRQWQAMDSMRVIEDTVKHNMTLILDLDSEPLYIAAQEVMTSKYVYDYVAQLAQHPQITPAVIGYSTLGKPLPLLHIGNAEARNTIAVLGRQHPPEATGFLALQAFINRIIAEDSLSNAFRNAFLLELVPMVNPDGVDQGHWRHSAGGIDLNRDWQYFNQPETAAIRDYFVELMEDPGRKMLFEIDFHSTQEDLFYVFDPEKPTNMKGFTHAWIDGIEADLSWYTADRVPTSGDSPVSTQWFFANFNTEAVTYEVGDDSPRDTIRIIGESAAENLMGIMLKEYSATDIQ